MTIRYFLRKQYPGYFSIEQIFDAVCRYMPFLLPPGISSDQKKVPFYFGPVKFIRNIRFVRKHAKEINHITGDIHYAILGCPASALNVLTIHDCVLLEKYRRFDPRYWIFRLLWYDLPMRKADLITVVSEKTRTELEEKIGYGKEKIRVVNNFVNPAFAYTPRAFNKAKPALLFIGSTVNKNLDRVLGAVQGIRCRLEIVGEISEQPQPTIDTNGIVASLSYALPFEDLVAKYMECDMVLFPSLYEGFGMLIVEGNAVGRPVITSNLSPMKEIAGTAALLVDPYDKNSIRHAILQIIEDDTYRDQLIREGIANAKRFSLETTVSRYIQLYKTCRKPCAESVEF